MFKNKNPRACSVSENFTSAGSHTKKKTVLKKLHIQYSSDLNASCQLCSIGKIPLRRSSLRMRMSCFIESKIFVRSYKIISVYIRTICGILISYSYILYRISFLCAQPFFLFDGVVLFKLKCSSAINITSLLCSWFVEDTIIKPFDISLWFNFTCDERWLTGVFSGTSGYFGGSTVISLHLQLQTLQLTLHCFLLF